MEVDVDIDDQPVLDALAALLARGSDLTPAMREIAGVLADIPERALAEEADPATGRPWHPLAPATVEARGGDAHPILQLSGHLAASIQSEHGRDYAAAGTNVVYAAAHQFGLGERSSVRSRRRMPALPARPFLGLGPEDRRSILDIVQRHLSAE